jgi:hypothetical protein
MANNMEHVFEKNLSFRLTKDSFLTEGNFIIPPVEMRVFGDTDVVLRLSAFPVSSREQTILFDFVGNEREKNAHCSVQIEIRDGGDGRIVSSGRAEADLPFFHNFYADFDFARDFAMDVSVRLVFSRDPTPPPLSMGEFASPLFDEKIFSDVTVVCADRKFYCHRIVLARRSTVFLTMLKGTYVYDLKQFEFVYFGFLPINLILTFFRCGCPQLSN